MRFLDGVFFYKNIGASTLKEYQPGTNTLIDSPIKVGIEYVYEDIIQTVAFKGETILPKIQLKDFALPRFTANKSEECTHFGRWFDYAVDGTTHKATNADGSSLAFRISGATKLNIGLYAINTPKYTPYYAYSIDGSEFVRKKITDTTIPIADAGEHWVWIVVDGMGENDPVAGGKWYGQVGIYFGGITTDGVICGVNVANRQIMFIGDSIVEGINVLGDGANADTNSATSGFAFKTARMLNAIPLLCGYGGTAVLGNSSFHRPIEAVDFNLNGVPVNEQHPDIICIEHGYNDGTLVSNGSYSSDEFKAGYNALLDRIKTKYPGVPIICMIPFKQSMKSEIVECTHGRDCCYVIETTDWGITYTDNAHPNENGASVAAEKLSKGIVSLFGKQYFM
jgi:lysophospholipase L1-like esterase